MLLLSLELRGFGLIMLRLARARDLYIIPHLLMLTRLPIDPIYRPCALLLGSRTERSDHHL